ncbi:MAG TPA: acyl-CoA synthetase [Solirubrobacteraceae bacterium]|nr:acyl-CoA synthetase [Solirubrobacteraceae bacterium]
MARRQAGQPTNRHYVKNSTRYKLQVAASLLRTGMAAGARPDRIFRAMGVLRAWGPGLASGCMTAAARYPGRTAIVDERGTLTFGEMNERTNALANALLARSIGPGSGVAVMCRNHRGFIDATVGIAKAGADVLYLNTEFGAPAIASVLRREGAQALIYDEEFAGLVSEGGAGLMRFVAHHEPDSAPADTSLEELIASSSALPPKAPERPGRVIILTSGTTGAPKGALRRPPSSLEPAAAIYSSIPLRARETTVIAAPLFHSWGYAHFILSLPLASTIVLRRRFDPEETLRAVAQHRASALIVVPVMLQRILELPEATLRRYDTSCLRVIASSGSALPGELALRVMDAFGDVLYNLYGSTEVAWVSVAGPQDLRAAPGTAGRPPLGTAVQLLDEHGQPVAPGERGRIFAANSFVFDGYTDGSNKEVRGEFTSTGDVGHFDAQGRLFVDGRDDEMIISGGENVYPREVEDLLATHEDVEEVAVVGVPDEEFGARLRAYIVPRAGASPGVEEIKDFVRRNLARYKVPRDVIFLDELPRNATGKILKRSLDATSAR